MHFKKNNLISLLLIMCIAFSITILAHPGRLDKNGGHWDRKEGTYHFHDGKSTNKGSSGSSSKSEYFYFVPPYEPPTDNPYRNNNAESTSDNNIATTNGKISGNTNASVDIEDVFSEIFSFLFAGFIVFIILAEVFSSISSEAKTGCLCLILTISGLLFLRWLFNSSIILGILGIAILILLVLLIRWLYKWILGIIQRLTAYENSIEFFKAQFTELELGKLSLPTSPFILPTYKLGADNLPQMSDHPYSKDDYTVYKSQKGFRLHRKYNCCGATIKTNIYKYHNYYNLETKLCKICCKDYKVPNMKWYTDHLKLQKKYPNLKLLETETQCAFNKMLLYHKKCNSKFFNFLLLFNKNKKQKRDELNEKYLTLYVGYKATY